MGDVMSKKKGKDDKNKKVHIAPTPKSKVMPPVSAPKELGKKDSKGKLSKDPVVNIQRDKILKTKGKDGEKKIAPISPAPKSKVMSPRSTPKGTSKDSKGKVSKDPFVNG